MSILLDDVQWPDTPFPLRAHAVLIGQRGSEAHGTYVPKTDPDSIDDRDLMGVCIPPQEHYYGLAHWDHAEAIKGEWDVVLYEWRKFLGLLCNQNPNVLSLLWLKPEMYVYRSEVGMHLILNRNVFRSKRTAYNSFMGYANGQLKRMTSFGQYQGYMGQKRKELVDRFGFDTKNAAHLIRLLRMGCEYLQTGKLVVDRSQHDANYLRSIKKGEVSHADIIREADYWFERCKSVYDNSPLPEQINMDAVNKFSIYMLQRWFA